MNSVKSKLDIYKKMEWIVIITILASFTGSSLVILSVPGFSLTVMRLFGLICLLISLSIIIQRPRTELYNVFILLIAISIVISSVISLSLPREVPILADTFICMGVLRLIVFTVDNANNSLETYKKYIFTFLCGLAITTLICVYEYVTGNHIAPNYTYGVTGHSYLYLLRAPTALLYNPNNVGVLFIVSIPILFVSRLLFKLKGYNGFFYVFLVVDYIILFMTGSRGAFVAGIILFILFLISSHIRFRSRIVLIVAGLFFWIYGKSFIMQQLNYGGMLKNGTLAIFNEGDGGRSYITEQVIDQVIKANPIFGAGAGGVEIITGSSAHNFPIEILGDYGIIGSLIFVFAFISLVLKTIKLRNKQMRRDLIILLIAVMFCMFIPPTLITLHFIWVIIGLMISYIHIENRGAYHEDPYIN